MRCQCGATIPDNVEYCPYCGKRQFIRTRPEKLTGTHIEPFEGDFSGDGSLHSCGSKVAFVLCLIILAVGFVCLWKAIGWTPEQIAQWLGLSGTVTFPDPAFPPPLTH